MTPEDARLCALLRCADETVDWTSANGLMGTASKRLEELSDELALHDASIEPMHRMMLERDRLKADLAVRDENYATLLKRWKEATQDLAIFRAENQRLKDMVG